MIEPGLTSQKICLSLRKKVNKKIISGVGILSWNKLSSFGTRDPSWTPINAKSVSIPKWYSGIRSPLSQ
jgi:hypothetical protein